MFTPNCVAFQPSSAYAPLIHPPKRLSQIMHKHIMGQLTLPTVEQTPFSFLVAWIVTNGAWVSWSYFDGATLSVARGARHTESPQDSRHLTHPPQFLTTPVFLCPGGARSSLKDRPRIQPLRRPREGMNGLGREVVPIRRSKSQSIREYRCRRPLAFVGGGANWWGISASA